MLLCWHLSLFNQNHKNRQLHYDILFQGYGMYRVKELSKTIGTHTHCYCYIPISNCFLFFITSADMLNFNLIVETLVLYKIQIWISLLSFISVSNTFIVCFLCYYYHLTYIISSYHLRGIIKGSWIKCDDKYK